VRWLAVVAIFIASSGTATAALESTMSNGLTRLALSVERGYSRAMGVLDPISLLQPDTASMINPFNSGIFPPRVPVGASWRLLVLNEEKTVLCLTQEVFNESSWRATVRGFQLAGLAAVDPESCMQSLEAFASSSRFPTVVAASKLLDRRDIPTASILPDEPVIQGVDESAKTRPGLTLHPFEGLGYTDISIMNPWMLLDTGPPEVIRSLSLTSAQVRPGFALSHNCADIEPGGSCTLRIAYDGQAGDYRVSSLRLLFSNGKVAVIGLLGRTR
jgi:hypothetical protein